MLALFVCAVSETHIYVMRKTIQNMWRVQLWHLDSLVSECLEMERPL